MYGAGDTFDLLLDRLHDMGCPPPQYGRIPGSTIIWCRVILPSHSVEHRGDTLDAAARGVLDCHLTASDKDRQTFPQTG